MLVGGGTHVFLDGVTLVVFCLNELYLGSDSL